MAVGHPEPDQISLLALDFTEGADLESMEGADSASVASHIQVCPACRQLAGLFQEVAALAALAAPVMTLPPRLRQQVMSRVQSRPAAGDRWLRPTLLLKAILAVLISAALMGWMGHRP